MITVCFDILSLILYTFIYLILCAMTWKIPGTEAHVQNTFVKPHHFSGLCFMLHCYTEDNSHNWLWQNSPIFLKHQYLVRIWLLQTCFYNTNCNMNFPWELDVQITQLHRIALVFFLPILPQRVVLPGAGNYNGNKCLNMNGMKQPMHVWWLPWTIYYDIASNSDSYCS